MPNWRSELPAAGVNQGWSLRRTPETGTIIAVCTSADLLVVDTHFWHGRTTPCERQCNEAGKTIDDSACPACVAKQGFRAHAYVSCFDAKRQEHFLFECTALAAKAFADYIASTGTLRGCAFCARRPKGVKNSKVYIECNTANLNKLHLPNPPDLIACLSIIWRLPKNSLITQEETQGEFRSGEASCPKATNIRTDASILKQQNEQDSNMVYPSITKDSAMSMGEILKSLEKPNGKAKKGMAVA